MTPKYLIDAAFLGFSLVLTVLPSTVFGITSEIKNRVSDLDPDDAIQGPVYESLQAAADSVEDEVNGTLLSVEGEGEFLKRISNSNAGAIKGAGVDYASSPRIFVVGGSASPSFSVNGGLGKIREAASFTNGFPEMGAAFQSSAMLGLNLGGVGVRSFGPIDPDKLVLSVNFMALSFDDLIEDLSFDFMNFGIHGTYTLFEPKWPGNFAFKWSGVQFTSGFDYSKNTLNYSTDFNVSQSVDVGATEDATITWNPTLHLGVESSVFSIPLEVSSSIKLLSFMGFYGGLGTDLNLGGSKLTGTTEAKVKAEYSGSDLGVDQLLEGDGILDATSEESVSPSIANIRTFVGTQLHISVVKIFAQVNYLTNSTISGVSGIRVAF